jgi:hypothetical protein
VREKLKSEGGIHDLPSDFPLEEMDHQSSDMDNYLGMTYTYSFSDGHGNVITVRFHFPPLEIHSELV